jgi:hypothetical protein
VPVKSAIVAKHEFIEVGIDVLAPQSVISAEAPSPQAGQIKPSGQRRRNKNAAQLASSEKAFWN